MSDSTTECVIPMSSAKSCSLTMCTLRICCATRSNQGLNKYLVGCCLCQSHIIDIQIAYKSMYTPLTTATSKFCKSTSTNITSLSPSSSLPPQHKATTRPKLQRGCRQICKKGHVLKAADINRHLLDLGIISKCFLVYHCKTPLLLLICKYESC